MIWVNILIWVFVASCTKCFEITLTEPRNVNKIGEKESFYSLDTDQIQAKVTSRTGRILRRNSVDLSIAGLEATFSWKNLLEGENRLAVGFNLFQGKKYVDNVILYSPRDGTYRVQGLKESSQYSGSIRLIRDRNQIQMSDSAADNHQFTLDTARIVQEKDKKRFVEFLSQLNSSKIELVSSSVTFRLPARIRQHYILEVQNTNDSSGASKIEIHIVPNSRTVILNDLPAKTILRMVLRRNDSTASSADVATAYLFTGSLTSAGDQDPSTPSSITRLAMYNRDRLEQVLSQTTNGNQEVTVACHVVNRRPFDGYPCPQSQVCLPLNWRCDGQQDCPGGLDEVGCGKTTYRSDSLDVRGPKPCKTGEASCTVNNVTMCLPNKWLCDGNQDCPDGWDEKQENCPLKIPRYSIPSLSEGIRRITNLLLRCRGAYFRCRSGECISESSVCDGANHCDDASDELYCDDEDDEDEEYEPDHVPYYEYPCHPRYEFKCYRSYSASSRRCVPRAWQCDSFRDCPHGEDEDSRLCSYQHLYN